MFQSTLNIIASICGCLACFLVLAATISLARRRFYAPMEDKQLSIAALVLFLAAIVLFNPTKSTGREVKASIAAVEMAARRTAYAKSATIVCEVQNASGEPIAQAQYAYERDGEEQSYSMTVQSGEQILRGGHALTLLETGFVDDGFTSAQESRKDDVDSYHFYKNFKQIFSKKRDIVQLYLRNLNAALPVENGGMALTQAELAQMEKQNDAAAGLYRRGLSLYQWEELYHVDAAGYLIGWEYFCDVKTPDGTREQQRWVYTVQDIVKNK